MSCHRRVVIDSFTLSSLFPSYQLHSHQNSLAFTSLPNLTFRLHSLKSPVLLQASRRASSGLGDDPRNWNSSINPEFMPDVGNDYDDDEDDDEEDRSLDLFVRFVGNMFKKISKRARKAVRSVLPVSISAKLVEFSVNGVLLLAFLWVLKAFLEVVCTLGSVVFVSILLIRGMWSGVAYLQERRYVKMNGFEDDHHMWNSTQPTT